MRQPNLRDSGDTSRGERTTKGRVERHDNVIHLLEVLEPTMVVGTLMREESGLVGPKDYHLLKRICIDIDPRLFNCSFA